MSATGERGRHLGRRERREERNVSEREGRRGRGGGAEVAGRQETETRRHGDTTHSQTRTHRRKEQVTE